MKPEQRKGVTAGSGALASILIFPVSADENACFSNIQLHVALFDPSLFPHKLREQQRQHCRQNEMHQQHFHQNNHRIIAFCRHRRIGRELAHQPCSAHPRAGGIIGHMYKIAGSQRCV